MEHCEKHEEHSPTCRDCYRVLVYGRPKTPARKSDPDESHKGVKAIAKGFTRNRALILRLDYPRGGLNYREIAAKSGIYPTSASRVITSMVREGTLYIHRTDGRTQYYLPSPQNGRISGSDIIPLEEF